MSAPRVSILIPAYNRADYLPETIASALGQTVRDIQVILVDDGSTDNTADIVRQIHDSRLIYIYQANRGVSDALDTAWRAAPTEYIAVLGSDDVMYPNQMETLLPLIESNPSLAVVYGRGRVIDAAGRPLPQIVGAPLKFPGKPLASLLYGDSITPMAVIIRRKCLEIVGGYDKSLIGNEDWDLWLRLAEHFQIAYCPELLVGYRVHSQNLTQSKSERNSRLLRDRVRVLDKFYARPDLSQEALDMKSLAYRNLYQDIAVRHVTAHRWRQALDYYAQSVRIAPNPVVALLRGVRNAVYQLGFGKTRLGVRLMNWWIT